MQPVDLSTIAQNLGPGTGGLWLGEQQKNAMQESELSQRNTLEQIANSQQTRDIQKQKLPFELQKMRDDNAMAPIARTKAELGNKETEAKLSKEKYNDFLDGLSQMDPQFVGMGDRAGYLNELSKRTGIDPEHPMYKMALMAHAAGAQQPPGPNNPWTKFQSSMDPKLRGERERLASQEGIHAATNTTQVKVAEIGAESRQEVARIRAEQAQAKAANIKETTDQLIARYTDEAMKERDPARKQELGQYIQFLQQGKIALNQAIGSGKVDDLERTMAMFSQEAQRRLPPPPKALPTVPGAQSAGGEPGQPPQGAPPMPQAAPPQGQPQQPPQAQPQQGGPAPGTRAKTKDGRDVQWDGKGWVLI